MRVKALKPHQNACGTKVGKDVGDEYDCSDRTGQQLAALGIVEIVGAVAAGADGDSALSAKNKAELQAIARDAGVEFGDADTKAVLVEKIEAARQVN
jgi:hypothetical protein